MRAEWLFISLLIISCGREISPEVENELSQLTQPVDYIFDVKPILSDRCFVCHGPDQEQLKGGLRLDVEEGALASLESGNGHAIVPFQMDKSQLVKRILDTDPETSMPPPESNLSLTNKEKAILIKWIKEGAEYKPHWAFTKPTKSQVPRSGEDWARNEIDRFIHSRLEGQGISPSVEAEREQLVRRLYFDLTGLPPDLDDLNRWISDDRPDYYERMVDELLESSAYGERMAAHWLDVARFADSEGYLDDFHHAFWPYRDWVIEAFNKNLPYDEFVLWQVGGDQMPGAGEEQMLATSFNRNHKQNSEGGIIPEEFRVEYVVDRTNTVGAAFMGLTLGCARCHDHKYDPISQKEYYQLFGFFNSTIERGDAIFSLNSIEYGQKVPNELSMNSGPVMPLASPEVRRIRDFLLNQIDEKQEEIDQEALDNESRFMEWYSNQKTAGSLERTVEKHTVSYLKFDDMADGRASDDAHGNNPVEYWGKIRAVEGRVGQAIRSDAAGQLIADGKKSAFERNQPFTISFWVKSPKVFERSHLIYNGNNRIQGYRGWDIVLDSNRVHFRLNHAHPYQSLDVRTPEPIEVDQWTHFVWTYDGSSKAEGMTLYQNGELLELEIVRNYLYRSTKPYFDPQATVYMPYKGIIIGNRHYDQDFTGGLIDELRILNREGDPVVAQYLFDPGKGTEAFLSAIETDPSDLTSFYDRMVDPILEQQRAELREIQAQEIMAIDTVQEIMVMGDYPREKSTFVLDRGVYDAHGERVERNVPEMIMPFPSELPRNRYGLGQWLIHPDHPLTSRVAVNQIWYLMFGRGIVETVEDFGNQGALPTHPDLLDWLAVDFQENGWDVKRLVRQLVTSSTYRQSSVIRSDLQEIDPDNRLLARGPRYRRSAEMVRDNILAVSGLLNDRIGGPSVFPYQPPGLWKEVMTHPFFPEYQVDHQNGLYRRSIYSFWKRAMPPPSMLIFDAASRAECQMRRQQSNTPLQALVLLNDPQFIEGSRVLAERAWRMTDGDATQASATAFRLLTSRKPTDAELDVLVRQFKDEMEYFTQDDPNRLTYLDVGNRKIASDLPPIQIAALTRVVNTVLNSTEAYYKN